MATDTYLVSGKVLIRPYGSDQAFKFVGLALECAIAVTQQEISLPNRVTPGGGKYDSVTRIEAITLNMTLGERKADVLAYALFGNHAPANGATVTDEEHVAAKGGYIQLTHPGPYTAVSVTDDATSPQAIGAAGNYELTEGGLYILPDANDIEDDDVIKVTYTYPAYDRIHALKTSAPLLEVHFNGANEADSAYPRNAKLWRVKLSPLDNLGLISGDEFSTFTVNGEVLLDDSKVGDLSQYFQIDQVPAPSA